jgi:two-component system phosphate regulon sensor histidine kinase PhoR
MRMFNWNKTAVVFGIVTVYIIAAFGWWTVAHIRASRHLYREQREKLELMCYKATIDVNGAVAQEMFNDSNDLKKYFYNNYEGLEVVFDPDNSGPTGLESYLIRPTEDAYELLRKKNSRTTLMYALEGIVMMGLLFWGIIWIYRNLQNKLKLKRQQSNFLLSITHELKTPLASIKLYLETLQKRQLDKEQAATIVSNSLGDVSRLRDLVDNILLAAQLDTSKYELQHFEINLSEQVTNVVHKFVVPRNIQHRMNINVEKDVFLTTDEAATEMVLTNLLSNAVKYSPSDGKIDVQLRTDATHVILSVSDEGQGISAEDKEYIFSKFFRSGDEQTRKSKGTGLGLFIVKNLLNLLEAEIKVKDKQSKGTTFEITFKKDA